MLDVLERLGLEANVCGAGTGADFFCHGPELEVMSPVDGKALGRIACANRQDYDQIVKQAVTAFEAWRNVPAPVRGDAVRRIGIALRERKKDLAPLISMETGKILAEAEGEVQEMIDIADFAVGQSRMLYGANMHSERPGHRLYEQWHPLGPVGVITAFNFPVAVWSWNALIALIAGDSVIWKPSSKAALSAAAVMNIIWEVLRQQQLPEGLLSLLIGQREDVGEALLDDPRVPLISATGSVPLGRHVAQRVGARLGKTILELGGNNGIIVTADADLALAVKAIVFGAVGTAGQRCTTTRRLIVHQQIAPDLIDALINAYRQIQIGDPLAPDVLMGPLIDSQAVQQMQRALRDLEAQGGRVLYGGDVLSGGLYDVGTYVRPCICEARPEFPVVQQETFAPIVYVMQYTTLDEAIAYHNAVPQGLSSAIFTEKLREAERFLSAHGSDCGLANVNIGTSGAEIGGAFGGEKETGGGREAGSDAWKTYMRRQTCTINWSGEMPLAQGIRFGND